MGSVLYVDLKSQARKITDIIGKIPLKDVRQADCKRVVQRMDGLSRGYICKVTQLMRAAFDAAVDEDYMLKNPVPKKIRMPENAKPNGRRRAATDIYIEITPEMFALALTKINAAEDEKVPGKGV